MAYFAEIDENNFVLRVIAVSNADTANENGVEVESLGINFCRNLLGGRWVQTSYNTLGGQHPEGRPLRKNYAGIGFTYDAIRDAFIPPKPYASWLLNESTCRWEAPVPYPTDDKMYQWNEPTTSWVEVVN